MTRSSSAARLAWHMAWHGAGLAMLGLAWIGIGELLAIGPHHAGHEPAVAYLLALATFLLASAGLALATLGRGLLRRVVVSELWSPQKGPAHHARDQPGGGAS